MAFKIHNNTLYSILAICCLAFFGVFASAFYENTGEYVARQDVQIEEKRVVLSPAVAPQKNTLLVFGDVMLDRSVRTYIQSSTTAALFMYVEDDIRTADAAIINLEGPITEYPSVVSRENLQFTFATHTAQDLARVGVDIVSLANNHTHNFGKKGLEQTKKYLDDAGIVYFGSPYNNTEELVTRHTVGSTTVSFVGYHQFENPGIENVLKAIRTEKKLGNFVIFFPHWGSEYEKVAAPNQVAISEKVIESGADIIIGAHPHVIQNGDILENKPVFYSLGNFIFDQWFSEDVKYGLALLLTLDENNLISIELKPFYRNRYQPKWLTDEVRETWCREYIENTAFKTNQNNPCLLELP